MLTINTGVGGIITNNLITNPSNGDLMRYDAAADMWKNFTAAYLSGVAHDTTLTGDGTTLNPLSVVNPYTGVIHDSTLTGDGKTTQLSVVSSFSGVSTDTTLTGNGTGGNPLKVAAPWGGVLHDATLTGDGKTTNLSVVSSFSGVTTDATLTGNGTGGNPLKVAAPWAGASHDATLTGDGKTTNLSVVNPFTGVIHDATLTGDGKTTNLSVVSPWNGATTAARLTGDGKATALDLAASGVTAFTNNLNGMMSVNLYGQITSWISMSNQAAQWWQIQSFAGGFVNILANNLKAGVTNVTNNVVLGTGMYTAPYTGFYLMGFNSDTGTTTGGTYRTTYGRNFTTGNDVCTCVFTATTAGIVSFMSATGLVYVPSGTQLGFRCTQNSGATVTGNFNVFIVPHIV